MKLLTLNNPLGITIKGCAWDGMMRKMTNVGQGSMTRGKVGSKVYEYL